MKKANKEVVIKLFGGLGNQMFQFAAGKSLSLRTKADLILDVSWFSKIEDNTTPRSYGLAPFKLPVRIYSRQTSSYTKSISKLFSELLVYYYRSAMFKCVKEPHFHYWKGFEKLSKKRSSFIAVTLSF